MGSSERKAKGSFGQKEFDISNMGETALFLSVLSNNITYSTDLTIIKLASMIFILVLENHPIKTLDIFDTVF